MVKTIEYERYQFKLIKQETEETFDSFVCRLYTQSRKCDFNDIDSQMKDQIIEKCQSDSLRREAFRNTMTLDQLILKGRTIETKNKSLEMHRKKILQQESVEKKSGKNINERNDQPNINSHQNEDRQNSNHRSGERPTSYNIEVAVQSRQNYVPKRHSEECNRCGFDDHFYTSSKCPARGEQCGYCGKFGHYSRMCFDMAFVNKRPHRDESTNRPSKFPRYSAETRSSSQDNKFASKSSLESDNKKTRDNEWPKIENTRKKNSDPLHSNVVADSLKSSNSEAHIENKNATLEFKTNESVGKIRIKSVQSLLSPPRLEKQKVECKQTVK